MEQLKFFNEESQNATVNANMEVKEQSAGDIIQPSLRALRVLIVDDDPDFTRLLMKTLESEGLLVETAANFTAMKEILGNFKFDAALVDVYLGDENGLNVMEHISREAPCIRIFMMTAQDTVSLAVNAMEQGAKSFLPKSLGIPRMVQLFKDKMVSESVTFRVSELSYKETNIIGVSAKIQMLLARINQMRDVDSTVLILGESGTGKELVARALHKCSNRAKGRFEAINCGAIPETLLESELFGHKRGAFTDAKTDKKGLFEICSSGTLLLDEIGDMPATLQVKLLRVLQEREVRPLGSTTTIKVNTRVIASTHKDLFEEALQNRFRQDLYFRLSVLQLWVPPLRERREDIPILVNHFLDMYSKRFGKFVKRPSYEVMARLMAHKWPGNVRELQNAIERAVVLTRDGDIRLDDIYQNTPYERSDEPATASNPAPSNGVELCFAEAREVFEKTFIRDLLTKTKGNISQTARLSGKHRVEIYRLLEKYHIDPQEFRNR